MADAPATPAVLNLAAFIAVAQHEIQKVTEYLAHPALRHVDAASPSPIIPVLGVMRMKIPVQMWQAPAPLPPANPAPPSAPEQLLLPGLVWPPGGQQAYTIAVRTVSGSSGEAARDCMGYLELEFTPCPKQ